MSESAFNILVVCTGNICRSPIAEQLLRERLHQTAPGGLFRVGSAGTQALVDRGMTPEALDQSQRYGGATNNHRARQLTSELITEADLVLTATRQHRGDVVSLLPRANRYSYTLTQLARLLAPVAEAGEGPRVTPQTFLTEIAASQGQFPPPPNPFDDDIEDPFRQSHEVYDRVGTAIDRATRIIAAALARTSSPA